MPPYNDLDHPESEEEEEEEEESSDGDVPDWLLYTGLAVVSLGLYLYYRPTTPEPIAPVAPISPLG